MLQGVLRRGNYATSDLQASSGPDRDHELSIIDRIQAGMIMPEDYPSSARRNTEFDHMALSNWENEGGNTDLSWSDRTGFIGMAR